MNQLNGESLRGPHGRGCDCFVRNGGKLAYQEPLCTKPYMARIRWVSCWILVEGLRFPSGSFYSAKTIIPSTSTKKLTRLGA
jgi:hypothetical protein